MEPYFHINIAIITVILPLISFIVLFFGRKRIPYEGDWLATGVMVVCTVLSIVNFLHIWLAQVRYKLDLDWFTFDLLQFKVGVYLDRTAALMFALVCFVSLLVHVFSIAYMKGDRRYSRYFAFLGLFTFSMLGLVLSDNLLIIYVFWEVVGLCSYLLIGFWYEREKAIKAAKKAFLLNRVGDIGFLIGIMIIWSEFGTFNIDAIEVTSIANAPLITVAGLGLLAGAIGKSAQFPLSVWLPDAMEGPTPASALIHAATMVAAGIYLLARVHFLLNTTVLDTIVCIGAVSAFTAASAALTQTDIKKVLAYSTISQLGYMLMAIGVNAVEPAMFHLLTHAFFKACLFLCAGAVIHAFHHHSDQQPHHPDPQDMRQMGGLRRRMPVVFVCHLIAALSLAGIPFSSGFLSKEAILTAIAQWAWGTTSWWKYLILFMAFGTAFMTAFYITRQVVLVYFGKPRFSHRAQLGSVPVIMLIPLIILAVLSIGLMFSVNPFHGEHGWFMSNIDLSTEMTLSPKIAVFIASLMTVIGGLLASYFVYRARPVSAIPAAYQSFLFRLSYNFWFLNKLYEMIFSRSAIAITRLLLYIEEKIIDGFVNLVGFTTVGIAYVLAWADRFLVDGTVKTIALLTREFATFSRNLQSGRVQMYFVWAMLGLIGLIVWILNG